MIRHTAIENAPGLRPRAVYFEGPDGTLRYTVIRPAGPSRIADYQFTPDGSRCLRRVLSECGTEVLFKEVVYLGDRPRCSCGVADHTAITAEKLETLRRTAERHLPSDVFWDLQFGTHCHPEPSGVEGEYDGGHLPSGIGWFDHNGQPTDGDGRIEWDVDVPEAHLRADPKPVPSRFLTNLAGADAGGHAEVLAPIVERVLFRTVTHPPRLAGGWDDLFQEGITTALREAIKLSPESGESLDHYAARLERRVALAVKHRLIDAVRRQDAANRNTPAASLEAGEGVGIDIPASQDDPFDLLFRLPEQREHRARFRAIALAVYRDARGLARRIVRRAYLGVIVGRNNRGTLELRDHPEYPGAARWLADAWARSMAQAMQGGLTPAYHRRKRRLAGTAA